MREIKFRVLDERLNCIFPIIKLNKAIEGECEVDSCYYMNERNELEWLPFAEGILMQYTGLKDKNGVEIYEGDIIKYQRKGISELLVVEWCKDYASFMFGHIKVEFALRYGEVIGNIYENPELLEG